MQDLLFVALYSRQLSELGFFKIVTMEKEKLRLAQHRYIQCPSKPGHLSSKPYYCQSCERVLVSLSISTLVFRLSFLFGTPVLPPCLFSVATSFSTMSLSDIFLPCHNQSPISSQLSYTSIPFNLSAFYTLHRSVHFSISLFTFQCFSHFFTPPLTSYASLSPWQFPNFFSTTHSTCFPGSYAVFVISMP